MYTRRQLIAGMAALALLPRPARAEKPVVLLLTSDDSARTTTIVDAFKSATEGTTRISYALTAESDAAAFLADNIRDLTVNAVFAVGDKAFLGAIREFATTPVIYVEVNDPGAALGRGATYGVPSRVDPAGSLAALRGLLPRMSTLGMVRGSRDGEDAWWNALTEAGKSTGVQVRIQRVNGPADLTSAFGVLLSESQAVILHPDATVWTAAAVGQILHNGQLAKVPVVGYDRSQLRAANPAPLILETSAAGVGLAAGARCMSVLGLATGGAQAVYPLPWLVGSKVACRATGMLLTKDTAAKVNEWID